MVNHDSMAEDCVDLQEMNSSAMQRDLENTRAYIFFDFPPWKIKFRGQIIKCSDSEALFETDNALIPLETLVEAEPYLHLQVDISSHTEEPSFDSILIQARCAERESKHNRLYLRLQLHFGDPHEAQTFRERLTTVN